MFNPIKKNITMAFQFGERDKKNDLEIKVFTNNKDKGYL